MFDESTLGEALSPRRLHLILLPTEKCNFRCTYCYEDFAIGRMRAAVANGVKRLLETRVPTLDALALSWFGGEPLLAKALVLDIGAYAHKLCSAHGIHFTAHTTTNGYLLTEPLLIDLLKIAHSQYQITLDGDEEWHDKTRVLANRKPTFEKIWSNLLSYRNIDARFDIVLRLHLHQENIESVRRLYRRLKSDMLDDERFSVFFHRVSILGSAPIKERVLGQREYLDAIAYVMEGDPTAQALDSGISEEHLKGYICYAAKPNSLMIRASGRIGKCTVALDDDRNDVGKINEDGTLDISNEKLRKWFSGFADLSEETLGCPASTLERPTEKPLVWRNRDESALVPSALPRSGG